MRPGRPVRPGRPEADGGPAAGPGPSWIHLIAAAVFLIWALSLAIPEQPGSFLHWIDLAFHEAGHLVFAPFGRTLMLLGGTILQLAVPAALCGYFLKQRSPFSAAFCLFWFGENFIDVSVYMADARALRLPLVGGGEHDWNNLFYQFGLLAEDRVSAIATTTHHLGVLLMLGAALWVALLALPPERKSALAARLADRLPILRPLLD